MKHALATLAILAVFASDATADTIPPFGPGPNPVGCSNVGPGSTRGPRSRNFAGSQRSHRSGGSTTWSSAETTHGVVTPPPSG